MSIFKTNSIHPDYLNNNSDQENAIKKNRLTKLLKQNTIIGCLLLLMLLIVNVVMLSIPNISSYIPNDSLQTVIAYDPNELNNICFSENGVTEKKLIDICKKYFDKNSNYSFYIVITKQKSNYILASTIDIDLTSETLDFVKDFKLDNRDNIFVKSDLSNTFLKQNTIGLNSESTKSSFDTITIEIISKTKSDETNQNTKILIFSITIFLILVYLWSMWILKNAIKKLEKIK